MALAAAMMVAVPAQAVLDSFGPIDEPSPPGHGFPLWYRATDGMSLELCLDETAVNAAFPLNTLCLLDRPELPDPIGAVVFPDNFWPEAFWTRVDSDMPTNTFTDPVSGQPVNGSALLVTALEGAFSSADGGASVGENISFARIRVRIDNPVDGATYRVTHPFGTMTFANVPLGARAVNFTDDIGIPVPPPPPTDFTGALLGPIGPFLRWTAPDFPVLDQNGNAYIGDPNIPHSMTGSPFSTNFFRIEGPPGLASPGNPNQCADPLLGNDPADTSDCIETDLFIGSGKIANDADQDGIPDLGDNCTLVVNADQRDTDADGYGNICDADFNDNGIVDPGDFSTLKAALGTAAADQDLNGNGIVDPSDFSRLKANLGQPPGPSALAP
jgi:hypothetical protein